MSRAHNTLARIVGAYCVAAYVMTAPLVNHAHLGTASYEGDARLLIWTLAWDAHALLSGTPLFDANIFHPAPRALSWAEHHVGIGVFATPLYAATGNPVLVYWILWLAAFPLNALAMHALAFRATRDHGAAMLAGLVYAFCFFRMHHAHGHIQLLWTWALPLVALALDGWLRRPRWRTAALLTGLVLVQALTSWYLAVFAILLALITALAAARDVQWSVRHVSQAAICIVAGAGILAWFAAPYVSLPAGPSAEAAANSADLRAYLLPPENTAFGQLLLRYTTLEPRSIWGERTVYVGITTLALAGVGVWRLRGRRNDPVVAGVVLTGLLACGLSFGPSSTGASPFDLFTRLPGMALLRAPARFALLVMLAAALLTAIGTAGLRSRFRTALVGLFALAILFESYVLEFPGGRPTPVKVPAVYEQLTRLPPGPTLSLPTYRGTPEAFREADYLLFSTVHWNPIVNGFGRHEPADHGARMDLFAGFPSPDALDGLRDAGVRYVVVHTRRAGELSDRASRALVVPGVQLMYEEDGDYLFQIQQPAWSDP